MTSPGIRGALSRAWARAAGSPFAKPVARVVLAAAGLVLLAMIGRAGTAGAFGVPAAPSVAPVIIFTADASTLGPPPPPQAPLAAAPPAPERAPPPSGEARTRATPDDPVFLNAATADDLRRLPGIGQKRADAVLALRARMGRFHAVEDLMKVKGIGRAMLRRLRPLVRLDPLGPADAGP